LNNFQVETDKGVGCHLDDTFITLDKVKSRDFYRYFNSKCSTEPVSSARLKRVFSLDNNECCSVYEIPFICTLDSRLRWLQYRITHGILVTNSWLKTVGIKDVDTCVYCDQRETIEHLYTECNVVNTFWSDVGSMIHFLPNLNSFVKLYGHIASGDKFHLINQVLLIARQCIYVCRCVGKIPTLNFFKNLLKVTMCLERVIALKRDKLDFHLEKWGPMVTL